ncbi:MAG: hypothetical protein ACE14V_11070 [bacterium]
MKKLILLSIFILIILISCSSEDIVINYDLDLSQLENLKIKPISTLTGFPKPTNIYAQNGINTSSKKKQPSGITDWYGYEPHSDMPNRYIEIDVNVFTDETAAIELTEFEVNHRWYKPKLDKFIKGKLKNDIYYYRSYILQNRSDPEGCNMPMDSYSSFLLLRYSNILISIDVHEVKTKQPKGITISELNYVKSLLEANDKK